MLAIYNNNNIYNSISGQHYIAAAANVVAANVVANAANTVVHDATTDAAATDATAPMVAANAA